MKQAIRRSGEVGGPLGAWSTILAYARTVRIFFRYPGAEANALSSCRQIESGHIDGLEAWREAEGKSGIHAFILLSKMVVILREIDANDPNRISNLPDRAMPTAPSWQSSCAIQHEPMLPQ